MRILHIIDHLGFGGAQTVVKGIFETQQGNKDIFLFVLRKSKRTIEIRHENVINYDTKARYSFAPLKELRKFILAKNIDILHCHLFRSQIFGYILKKWYFPKIHLIFHEQGSIIGCDKRNLLADYWYGQFMRMSTKHVDTVIAVSHAVKRKLTEKANILPEKIAVLYNFVDLQKFNPRQLATMKREKLGIHPDDFVVGFAGRIIERKGWQEYVSAAQMLSQSISNIKFLISGDGDERGELLALIKHYHLQEQILFLGYVPEMLEFYSYLDCFVLPSYWEGLALTQLEVMALGIPLVTSDGPGLNEIPQNNIDALFVEIKNAKDLADKISKLYYDQELRAKFKKNACVNVKKYSLDNFLLELRKIYRAEY